MEIMSSPIMDTFRDIRYFLVAIPILVAYGIALLFFDQFLFFSPYFTFYVSHSGDMNLILDLLLTVLTTIVLTVSIRQVLFQRTAGGGATKSGAIGIVAAILAGACPCYYLIPLLAVAGTVGGALGAAGILLDAYQIPIKLAATLILFFTAYKLNKSNTCKVKAPTRNLAQKRQQLAS